MGNVATTFDVDEGLVQAALLEARDEITGIHAEGRRCFFVVRMTSTSEPFISLLDPQARDLEFFVDGRDLAAQNAVPGALDDQFDRDVFRIWRSYDTDTVIPVIVVRLAPPTHTGVKISHLPRAGARPYCGRCGASLGADGHTCVEVGEK